MLIVFLASCCFLTSYLTFYHSEISRWCRWLRPCVVFSQNQLMRQCFSPLVCPPYLPPHFLDSKAPSSMLVQRSTLPCLFPHRSPTSHVCIPFYSRKQLLTEHYQKKLYNPTNCTWIAKEITNYSAEMYLMFLICVQSLHHCLLLI